MKVKSCYEQLGDSNDFVLWLSFDYKFFTRKTQLKIPIFIGKIKNGESEAKDKLDFFLNKDILLTLPFPSTTFAFSDFVNEKRLFKVNFKIRQIPDSNLST